MVMRRGDRPAVADVHACVLTAPAGVAGVLRTRLGGRPPAVRVGGGVTKDTGRPAPGGRLGATGAMKWRFGPVVPPSSLPVGAGSPVGQDAVSVGGYLQPRRSGRWRRRAGMTCTRQRSGGPAGAVNHAVPGSCPAAAPTASRRAAGRQAGTNAPCGPQPGTAPGSLGNTRCQARHSTRR